MSDTTYNGWENKATWLVNLWVGEGAEPMVREFVSGLVGDTYHKTEQVKDYVLEIFGLEEQLATAGFGSDLMGWAVAHINWFELLEAWEEDLE